MTALLQDVRFALRAYAREPGFAAVAVLTLALGIGVTTAVFSVVEGVLLRAMPYPGADRVVEVWNRWSGEEQAPLAVPELAAYRGRSASYEGFAGLYTGTVNVGGGAAPPERVQAVVAGVDLFAVLGLRPAHGRTFAAGEDRPGGERVAIVSHELWTHRLGADPGAVGSSILLDGEPCAVVGVLPPGARLPQDHRLGSRTDVWLPLQLDPADPGNWGSHFLSGLARRRPGVSRERAQAELDGIVARLKSEHRGSRDAVGSDSFGAALHPLREQVVGGFRRPLLVLMAAAGLVLVVACANVANLMLARAEARRGEIHLRAYLGASRRRLARQLLTESVVLAAGGGLAGLALAAGALELLQAIGPGDVPRLREVGIAPAVLAVAAAASLLAGLALGALPAVSSLGASLRAALSTGRGAAEAAVRGRWARGVLVALEVAVAVVVVAGAGLLAKSYRNLLRVDPGFRADHVLTLELDLPEVSYPESADVLGFVDRLERRVASLPGVAAAGAANRLPLSGGVGDWNLYLEGETYPTTDRIPHADWHVVTAGYLPSMAIEVRAGRGLTDADDASAPLVALIGEELGRRHVPARPGAGGASPVGRRFRFGGRGERPWVTIVGVVADVRGRGLDVAPEPAVYVPLGQMPRALGRDVLRGISLAIRTSVPPLRLAEGVRRAVRDLDPGLPVARLRTLEEIRSASLAQRRFSTTLIGLFAALALALGAIGIFGVMSFLAARRRREIGIRLALGADRGAVTWMVARQAMRPVLAGIALGVAGALAAGRALAGQLYGLAAGDPAVLVAVPVALGAVALTAALLPARRAAAGEPVAVLRSL